MQCYEHTLIARENLTENQGKELISKYENIIKENSGKILKIQEWGLRTLSHRLKNNKKGFYFHIKLKGEGTTIEKLEEAENIDESVIRYLTIKIKKIDLDTNYFEKKEDQKVLGKDEKK